MFRLGTAVVALMVLPVAVRAQGAQALAGEWRNPSPRGAIVEARCRQGGRLAEAIR